MVQSRREPTISSSDFSAPLDEDGAGRKRQPAPPAPAKGGRGLAIFAFLIAAAGVAVGGYAVWQQQLVAQELVSASARIAALEKRLTLSDDESSQSVTALQANLKQAVKDIGTNESEIRKLWDTRNVNRKAISANRDKAQKTSEQLAGELKTLDQSVTALTAQQTTLVTEVGGLSEASASVERQLTKLREQLVELDAAAGKLAQLDQLSGRVRGNEEAIEAIDAYRLNINRQLVELQQRLGGDQ